MQPTTIDSPAAAALRVSEELGFEEPSPKLMVDWRSGRPWAYARQPGTGALPPSASLAEWAEAIGWSMRRVRLKRLEIFLRHGRRPPPEPAALDLAVLERRILAKVHLARKGSDPGPDSIHGLAFRRSGRPARWRSDGAHPAAAAAAEWLERSAREWLGGVCRIEMWVEAGSLSAHERLTLLREVGDVPGLAAWIAS